MSFNYSTEKKMFEEKWKELYKMYLKEGMKEDDIKSMMAYDWEMFKRNRVFYSHNGTLSVYCALDDCVKYYDLVPKFSSYDEYFNLQWVEHLENEELYEAIKNFSDNDKILLELYAINGMTQKELADYYGVSQSMISRKLNKIKNKLLELKRKTE